MSAPRTARELLLTVATNEGWTILHDLGLHVMVERGLRQINMQFDLDGRCIWCQDGPAGMSPVDVAMRWLIYRE